MLRTKAIRKIFITTLSLFIILIAYSFSSLNIKEEKVLRTNLEIESNLPKSYNVYLLNKENLLVKKKVYIESNNKQELVSKIINNLIINKNSKLIDGLQGTIPKNTKVKEIIIGNEIVTINFSKDILKVPSTIEKQMISSIVYSIIDIDNYKGISILVEGETLLYYPHSKEKLPSLLDKSIGINKTYNVTSRDNISKVVVYYVEKINDNSFYVPVTKYINDDRDKIKIIVEELSSSYIYESNLMSFLNNKVELLSYNEENNVMYLNFNDYLFDNNDKLLEEVVYTLSYSVFDNYDVNMVMFEVNNEPIRSINIAELR